MRASSDVSSPAPGWCGDECTAWGRITKDAMECCLSRSFDINNNINNINNNKQYVVWYNRDMRNSIFAGVSKIYAYKKTATLGSKTTNLIFAS